MADEELEKEAEKHADGIYHYKINVSDYGEDGIINYRYSDVKEAYIAGAKPREKKIAELKEKADREDNIIEGLKKQIAEMDLYSDKAKEIIKNLMVFAEMDCREYEEAYKEAE